MFAPAPVAASLFSWAFVTASRAALPVSGADQESGAAWRATRISSCLSIYSRDPQSLFFTLLSLPGHRKEGV